ncbi:unannotated protein [freshwater metagenome]|uniref:Unannotated protein n=1 Tax=freshwater metagenome TaxID=449393 RepID=A0A6J7J2J2_9ZZZZ
MLPARVASFVATVDWRMSDPALPVADSVVNSGRSQLSWGRPLHFGRYL